MLVFQTGLDVCIDKIEWIRNKSKKGRVMDGLKAVRLFLLFIKGLSSIKM